MPTEFEYITEKIVACTPLDGVKANAKTLLDEFCKGSFVDALRYIRSVGISPADIINAINLVGNENQGDALLFAGTAEAVTYMTPEVSDEEDYF